MWVDDRRGTYPKLTPELYNAIVQEAHARKMTVHAHAIQLADQKAVVAAGADVLVHMVQSEPIDEAFRALLRQKQPVLGDGDRPGRSDRSLHARIRSSRTRCHPRWWRRSAPRWSGRRWAELRAAVAERRERAKKSSPTTSRA